MNHQPWILPVVAGFLVILGTAIGLYLTYRYRADAMQKQETIEELQKHLNYKTDAISIVSKEIKSLVVMTNKLQNEQAIRSEEVKNLSSKIEGLTLNIDGYVTGGASNPKYSIFPMPNISSEVESHNPYVGVEVVGDYPLYIEHMNIENISSYKYLDNRSDWSESGSRNYFSMIELLARNQPSINSQIINPGYKIVSLGVIKIEPIMDSVEIKINTICRNGQFEQYILLGLSGGQFYIQSDYKILRKSLDAYRGGWVTIAEVGNYFKDYKGTEPPPDDLPFE